MLNSLQNTWKSLSLPQRAGLIGVLTAVFAGILLVATLAGRPSYAVLFSNLEPEDAGSVTSKLRDLKVDYHITQGGRAIEVPADKVYDLRLSLASDGLPKGGTVGFELFDHASFGMTGFTQKLNYQRALQGELTRTINRLDGVVESRVHLAIPEKQLFTQQEEPTTASVVLHLRPGYRIDNRQVAGIVHLVSSAVEGLKPENVSVHDAQGELLSSSGGDNPGLTGSQIQIQQEFEQRLQGELTGLAETVLGPGKAAVRVNADLNWDQTETTSESYKPGGPGGKNLPTEERTATETYGRKPDGTTGGVAGAPSNLGGGATPTGTASDGTAEPKQYENSQTTHRYAVDKVVEHKTIAPGKIRRVSVAVLLDDTINAAQQTALKNAFAAAAGLDVTPVAKGGRGDRIELLPIAFDRSLQAQESKDADKAAKDGYRIALVRNGAAVAVVVLIVIASLVMLRRLTSPRRPRFEAVVSDPLPISEAMGQAALGSDDIPEPSPRPRRPEPEPIFEELELIDLSPGRTVAAVKQLAAEHPEEVARELQVWMTE